MAVLESSLSLPSGVLVGEEVLSVASEGVLPHYNAATGALQREFAAAGAAEVDAAVDAARSALPVWAGLAPTARRDALLRLANLLRRRAKEYEEVVILEAGMVRWLAALQPLIAAEWIEYYAGWADKIEGTTVPMPGAFDYTVREPVGVVAMLLTWNGPLSAIGMKVPAALAAGCTVVLKSSELAPFSALMFGKLCLEAGLPPGTVNVVSGGPAAGDSLVRNPGIDKISFTGGRATAQRIQESAAKNLTPMVLELGGKSANIIFADADLGAAADSAAAGLSLMSGQTCVAPTRLLVQQDAYDEVVRAMVDRLSVLRMGDPGAVSTTMGPVISRVAAERILASVDQARSSGVGKLLLGGERPAVDLLPGYFVPPTVFGEVDPASDLAQTELFGPVLSITPFRDEDEAVSIANASSFGLAAYLHTGSLSRAVRMAAALETGNVAVNGGTSVAGPAAPFGGFKGSGYGKEGGFDGLLEFTRTKNVNVRL